MYNIQDGHVFGLPQVIHAVDRSHYDLVLLTETDIPDEVYYHNPLGYEVIFYESTVNTAVGTPGGGRGV